MDKELYLNSLKQEQLEKLKTRYNYHQYIRIKCPDCKNILYLTDLERMFKPEEYQNLLTLYKPEQAGICDSCTYPIYKNYFFTLNCEHRFHFNCLEGNINNSSDCMCCKQQIPNEVIKATKRGNYEIVDLNCSECGRASYPGNNIHSFSCNHNLHEKCVRGSKCPICGKELKGELEEIRQNKGLPYFSPPQSDITSGGAGEVVVIPQFLDVESSGNLGDPGFSTCNPSSNPKTQEGYGIYEPSIQSSPVPITKPLGYVENEEQGESAPDNNHPTKTMPQIKLKCGHDIDYRTITEYFNGNLSVTAFNGIYIYIYIYYILGQTLQFVGCSTCGQPLIEEDMRIILGSNFDAIISRDLAYYCTQCHNPLYDAHSPQHILTCGHKICPTCLEYSAQTNKIHYSTETASAMLYCDICTNIYQSKTNPFLGNNVIYLHRTNYIKMWMSEQIFRSIEFHI